MRSEAIFTLGGRIQTSLVVEKFALARVLRRQTEFNSVLVHGLNGRLPVNSRKTDQKGELRRVLPSVKWRAERKIRIERRPRLQFLRRLIRRMRFFCDTARRRASGPNVVRELRSERRRFPRGEPGRRGFSRRHVLERTRRIGAGPNEVRRHAGGAPYDRTEHDRKKGLHRMVPGCPARRRRTGFARFTHEAERQAGRSRAAERLVDQPGARERAGAALFQRRREVSGHRVDQLGARDLELQRRRSTLRSTRARPGRDGRATSATSARCRTAPDSDSTRPAATPACR